MNFASKKMINFCRNRGEIASFHFSSPVKVNNWVEKYAGFLTSHGKHGKVVVFRLFIGQDSNLVVINDKLPQCFFKNLSI